MKDINQLIKDHYGFIIQVVSQTTNRYVNVKNDDSFSIALLAFEEAVDKYQEHRGNFLSFAKLVMRSRIIDHLRREKKHQTTSSIEELAEAGRQFTDESNNHQSDLALEIEEWKEHLNNFDINLETLMNESPKHQNTRERAINISEKSSQHPPITDPLFEKKRLPIKLTAEYNDVSQKVIKGNKTFITSVIIIFYHQFTSLCDWIRRD